MVIKQYIEHLQGVEGARIYRLTAMSRLNERLLRVLEHHQPSFRFASAMVGALRDK